MRLLAKLGLGRERQPARVIPHAIAHERRAATFANPPDWFSQALIDGATTYIGKSVTAENSAAIVPVYSAVPLTRRRR